MTDVPGAVGGGDPRLMPPYPVHLVADLHADVLDEQLAAALWPLVVEDPAAAAVLVALDRMRVDLHDLGKDSVPVPAAVAARLDAALAAAGASPQPTAHPIARPTAHATGLPAPPDDLAAARRRRAAVAAAVGLAAAAAAVVVLAGTGSLGGGEIVGNALPADPGAAPETVPLSSADLATGGTLALLGEQDFGVLDEEGTLAGCLAANGVPAGTEVLGAAPVRLDGTEGVLLLLPTGTAGRITALVVGPGCSADDAAELARQDIGAR